MVASAAVAAFMAARRVRCESLLPDPQAGLLGLPGAAARDLRDVRPPGSGPGRRRASAVRALPASEARGVSRVRPADDRSRPQRPPAVRALLRTAGRDLRPPRAGPRDRSPRRRRRPGPVRRLLDGTYRRMRELREGAPVPWRAARADAVRLLRTGQIPGMRALRWRARSQRLRPLRRGACTLRPWPVRTLRPSRPPHRVARRPVSTATSRRWARSRIGWCCVATGARASVPCSATEA